MFSQIHTFERNIAFAGLVGAFRKRTIKRGVYSSLGYRDTDQKLRMAYIGPNSEGVQALIHRFEKTCRDKPLAPPAKMDVGTGCAAGTSS